MSLKTHDIGPKCQLELGRNTRGPVKKISEYIGIFSIKVIEYLCIAKYIIIIIALSFELAFCSV